MEIGATKRSWPYIELGLSGAAVLLWAVYPAIGPWPLLLVAASWALRWFRTGRPTGRTTFDWPIAIFLATMVLSLWSAPDTAAALAKFWLLVGGLVLFNALANWLVGGPPSGTQVAGWLMAGYGAVIGASWLVDRAASLDLMGESLNPNIAAGAMLFSLPFQLAVSYLQWREQRWGRLVAGMGLVAVTAVGLLFSESRGAWIAAAVATSATLWWSGSRQLAGSRQKHARWFFGGLGIAVVLGWLALIIWSAELEALLGTWTAADGLVDRASLYRDGLLLGLDYPLIGAGLGNFMMVHASYALLTHVGFSTHSHNLLLDVSIEQGLFALLALFWLWLLMAEAVWRAMLVRKVRRRRGARPKKQTEERSTAGKRRVMLRAAGITVLMMAVHGLVDDTVYASRGAVVFFAPMAFAVPYLRLAETPSLRQRWTVGLVGVAAVLMVGLFYWRPLYSHLTGNLAAVEQARQELATYEWPEWPVQDALRREINLDGAIDGYQTALVIHPENASAARRLGQIELSLGQYQLAEQHLRAAVDRAPWSAAARQLAGEAQVATGAVEQGAKVWATVDNNQSQLELRRFWYGYAGEELIAERVDQALEARLLLLAGQAD